MNLPPVSMDVSNTTRRLLFDFVKMSDETSKRYLMSPSCTIESRAVNEFIDVGIDFSMLVYPVAFDGLEKFENENSIGVYVFTWKESSKDKGFALQIRRPSDMFARAVQLLLFRGHYLLIKNFNAFINLQSFGHRNNSRTCHNCL